MASWRDQDSPTAYQRREDDAHRAAWAIAHGYLPDPCPPPPRDDIHLCGSRGYYITGSRRDCPHCKIAAPGKGR